jgi:glycogen synthase
LQVRGILNGIDVVEWDPAADPLLPANYNAQFPDGKKICKKYLQKVRGGQGGRGHIAQLIRPLSQSTAMA